MTRINLFVLLSTGDPWKTSPGMQKKVNVCCKDRCLEEEKIIANFKEALFLLS